MRAGSSSGAASRDRAERRCGQSACVVERSDRVVHQARPGDHEHAVVGPVEHSPDLDAGALHERHGRFAQRQFLEQGRWGTAADHSRRCRYLGCATSGASPSGRAAVRGPGDTRADATPSRCAPGRPWPAEAHQRVLNVATYSAKLVPILNDHAGCADPRRLSRMCVVADSKATPGAYGRVPFFDPGGSFRGTHDRAGRPRAARGAAG
jgi:hypothetical protein